MDLVLDEIKTNSLYGPWSKYRKKEKIKILRPGSFWQNFTVKP
jgi:hypothetical protein